MTILTDVFVLVIVSSIQKNRARCALYKKILDLLDEENISGENVVELVDTFFSSRNELARPVRQEVLS